MKRHPLSDLDADIRDHIERETQDNIGRGMAPEDARAAALRAFGNVTLIREDTRAVWVPVILDQLAQDVRYALRGLRRQPGFSIAVIAMLTIGLGLLTGAYTIFNGLFIRGWALPENDGVFRVIASRERTPAGAYVADGISRGAFAHIRQQARAAEYVALNIDSFRVRASGGSDSDYFYAAGMLVSDNAIEALRIPLQLGVGVGGAPTSGEPRVVISDRVWRRIFGADPHVAGRTAWLAGNPATIVGVTAAGFEGLGERALDVIVEMDAAALWERRPPDLSPDGTRCCVMLSGRIRSGWQRREAQEELTILTAQYRQSLGQPPLSVDLIGTTPGESMRRRPDDDLNAGVVIFALVGAAIVLVLLLTCANVGNLYLARSLRRQREIATRLSLGASRARVVRQLLTEGLVMASIAGSCAFLMTAGVPPALQLLEDNATASMFASDWRVAAFTAAAVIVTCLLVSLAPALQTTRIAWRGASPMMSPRTGRVRGIVLAAQIAIAAVLVVSAALLARGIQHAVSVPVDFALHTTTAATLAGPAGQTYSTNRANEIRDALTLAFKDAPLRAGIAGLVPASARAGAQTSVNLPGSAVMFRCKLVPLTASAAAVLELRLLAGRWPGDNPRAREAVINDTLARQIWPGASAVGRTLILSYDDVTYTIVGVAHDAHLTSLSDVEPMIHAPLTNGLLPVVLARTAPGAEAKLQALVKSIDPQLSVSFVPLSESIKQTLQNATVGAGIAAALGAIALLLSILGVFGVFSYLVEERRQEIGIRLALGASRGRIAAALLNATSGAIFGGLLAGLALSVTAGLLLRRFLFGLSPADPVSYGTVAVVLTVAAFIATAMPVRRALRVDPAITLRAE